MASKQTKERKLSDPAAPKPPFDAMTFWNVHGREKTQELCARVGTSYGYWKHIAHGRKRPSIDLARALSKASGGLMTVDSLIPVRAPNVMGAAE